MQSLGESIRRATSHPPARRSPTSRPPAATAQQIMAKRFVSLKPEQSIAEAAALLHRYELSAAPVLNRSGTLVGMLSEFDCMKTVASGSFYQEQEVVTAQVKDLMTQVLHTVDKDTSLFSICHRFMESEVRRLPVMDGEHLLGIVSRHDVLGAMAAA